MSSAHVPKFGNWEDEDIPYTTYFENARIDRTGGFNPNDPEDNPKAFTPQQYSLQNQHSRRKHSKSSSPKVNIDPPRLNAKSASYTVRSNSNASMTSNASLISKPLTTAVSSSSTDSNDIEPYVHQKPTYTAIFKEVNEKKQTEATENRKAMQKTSSKKWCCLSKKRGK